MFKKTSDGVKRYLDVFIKFSLIFCEKLIQNPEQKRVRRLSAQKTSKIIRLERTF